jgi:antitoxin component YwqK of YwqJK toxin-antitoxin module
MRNIFLSFLALFFLILIYSCENSVAILDKGVGATMISAGNSDLFGGMVYYDGSLYTGVRYRKNNDDEKVWEVQVKNGKYHGFYKEWYDGGNLKLKQAYNKNKRHGNNILYWDIQDSSNIRESGNYKQDAKTGVWNYWYQNGNLHYQENMKEGRRVLEGSIVFYYPNGNKKKELSYKNGLPNGMWRTWYEGGNLKTEGEYIKGEEEGVFIVNFNNGKLMRKEHFVKGKRKGDLYIYDKKGALINKKTY